MTYKTVCEYLLLAKFINNLFREIPHMETLFYYYWSSLVSLNKGCYLKRLPFLRKI